MNRAANWIQFTSYGAVVAIGLWLVWRKGGELVAALQRNFEHGQALAAAPAYAGIAWNSPRLALSTAQFRAVSPGVADAWAKGMRPCPCPTAGLDGVFSWRDAAGMVIAAGVRPCSGAILMLVFAQAQGLFAAGVEATFAMAVGTAVTQARSPRSPFSPSRRLCLAAGENSRAALVARCFDLLPHL